jgi:hypothetical protein
MKDEALDLALKALEYLLENKTIHYTYRTKADEAITAIKQALALDKMAENARELGLDYEPHKGLSEHLAQVTNGRVRIDPVTGDVGIGTPAAQRQWVGLTDEEMQALWDRYAHMEMMRAIEAKLKEKNT